jgi:hypothetical protein
MQPPVLVAYNTGLTTGTTVTSGASTANTALPTNSDGQNPNFVMLSCVSGNVHVKLGGSGVTATANDLMIGITPVVLFTKGCGGYIAYIQETAGSKLNIAPVES